MRRNHMFITTTAVILGICASGSSASAATPANSIASSASPDAVNYASMSVATTETPGMIETTEVVPYDFVASPEWNTYVATLSETERATFEAENIPVSQTVVVTVTPLDATARESAAAATAAGERVAASYSGCWTSKATWTPRNVSNIELFTYWHQTNACASNNEITNLYFSGSGGWGIAGGYVYQGVKESKIGVVLAGHGISLTKHRIALIVGGVTFRTYNECGRILQFSDGWATQDARCYI